MTLNTTVPRSRRAILAGTAGALAALSVQAVSHPERVLAHDSDDVALGHGNSATDTTAISNSTADIDAFRATASGYGRGIHGYGPTGQGVHGESNSGDGVSGTSLSGDGVSGNSGSRYGVSGTSPSIGVHGETQSGVAGVDGAAVMLTPDSHEAYGVRGTTNLKKGRGVFGWNTNLDTGEGVWGQSNGAKGAGVRGYAWDDSSATGKFGTGVLGSSGSHAFPPPAPRANTGVMGVAGGSSAAGVYGYAAQDASSRGVTGQTTAGYGINGIASTGTGVCGAANTGIGTRGWAATGTAGYFGTSGPKSGVALRAIGRVKLDNCAGLATIAAGNISIVVTPGSDLLPTSAVVATLQGNPSGSATVKSVAVNATADTFTIYLTANATAAVTVAWHVFG